MKRAKGRIETWQERIGAPPWATHQNVIGSGYEMQAEIDDLRTAARVMGDALTKILRLASPDSELHRTAQNALAKSGMPAPCNVGEADLFDDISCDLPRLFAEAAKEGAQASERLARNLQARLWTARQRHIAPMADPVPLIRSVMVPNAWQEATPAQFDRAKAQGMETRVLYEAASFRTSYLNATMPNTEV